ncbi:DUF2971 domain-containing protein [Enterovibrio norvegicus]|uniref:DUF2971 domain-containing protein n=1 Tax=Enterovibrio norvegicus TaxID=188144 RepID=UPI00352C6286
MELIYHYTSVAGLKGILGQDTPTIRVTDSRYLNDSNEILRGVERAMSEISQSLSAKKYEEPIPNTIEFMESIINSIGRSLFFTASFCKEGDKLAQWVSYCPVNGGYSIGFDRAALLACAEDSRFEIHDVSYNEEPYKFIASAANVEHAIDAVENQVERDLALYNLVPIAAREIALTKDAKFETENEVRLFSKRPSTDFSLTGLDFFEKNSILVPFLPFGFPKNVVKKVIVGPMQHKELALQSLEMFKTANGYDFTVEFSQVPLRQF